MTSGIKTIVKRDGSVANFDASKIARAIFKSLEATGDPNLDLANALTAKVIENISSGLKENEQASVEQIQDFVEQTLVSQGQAKAAKAYILYRQKRTEIRKQKQQVLNKEIIDEVDKVFDLNSLRVLCSRYLRKDENGEIIESPKQLFQRVAVHVVLPSLFYSEKLLREPGEPFADDEVNFQSLALSGKLKIGEFTLNEFHLEGLSRVYQRFNKEGKVKVSFRNLLLMIGKGEFDEFSGEIQDYFEIMAQRKFFPNTPTLANFGNYLGMGSACFAIPVEDSIESIMEALKKAAIIFKGGGGVGYNFSHLRPEGDFIKTTSGKSSGPISFMTLFDKMSDVVRQGGIRRGASMGIMNSNHPDIERFVTAKRGNLQLTNFNISVLIKEDFWQHYAERTPYPLRNPRDGEVVRYIDPKALFDLIVYQAWESAEPGVLFDEQINKYNPFLETLGPIECTNPCSELPLYPWGSCNLGSINVWSFCKVKPANGKAKHVEFDWQDFQRTIKLATRFLDNVVDINKYPLPEIEEKTLSMRKIGLGLMGLADVLYELEVPYNSSEGLEMMEKLMETLNYYSKQVSIEMARERGKFPIYDKSFYVKGILPFRGEGTQAGELPFTEKQGEVLDWQILKEKIKEHGLRNAQTTTNAPTGSISMIAGCSSGIEPNFSLVFEKKVSIGSFYYVNPIFEKVMEREGLFDEDLIKEVSERRGSIQSLSYIPPRLKSIFVTAMDIEAKDHIKALAAFQKWTDSSISKTINFPSTASIEDMREAYLLAHQLGCKGLSVFRDQSIQGVLQAGARKDKPANQSSLGLPEKEEIKKSKPEADLKSLEDVKAKGPVIFHDAASAIPSALTANDNGNGHGDNCPKCQTTLVRTEGCKKCPKCGWALCGG